LRYEYLAQVLILTTPKLYHPVLQPCSIISNARLTPTQSIHSSTLCFTYPGTGCIKIRDSAELSRTITRLAQFKNFASIFSLSSSFYQGWSVPTTNTSPTSQFFTPQQQQYGFYKGQQTTPPDPNDMFPFRVKHGGSPKGEGQVEDDPWCLVISGLAGVLMSREVSP